MIIPAEDFLMWQLTVCDPLLNSVRITKTVICGRKQASMILLQETMSIGPEETAGELSERMAVIGAELLVKTLRALEKGELTAQEQDHEASTQCPMLAKEHGRIPWGDEARLIASRVRGVNPWPGAYTTLDGAGGIPTCLNHARHLGATHIQLMPV